MIITFSKLFDRLFEIFFDTTGSFRNYFNFQSQMIRPVKNPCKSSALNLLR